MELKVAEEAEGSGVASKLKSIGAVSVLKSVLPGEKSDGNPLGATVFTSMLVLVGSKPKSIDVTNEVGASKLKVTGKPGGGMVFTDALVLVGSRPKSIDVTNEIGTSKEKVTGRPGGGTVLIPMTVETTEVTPGPV